MKTTSSVNTPDSTVFYPYSPVYSSSFEKGNPLYSKKVLQIWKEYETGDIRKAAKSFADSITIIFPDRIFKGKKDSILELIKKRRDAYSDMQCYVDSWMPVYVRDRAEHIVFLWGRQDGTTKSGRRNYLVLHEIWRFDENGSIKKMEQYLTHAY